MVSVIRNLCRFCLPTAFLFLVASTLNATEFAVSLCPNGLGVAVNVSYCGDFCKMSCARCTTNGAYICGDLTLDPIETCTSGEVQYKPEGDCETTSRKCCDSRTWSDWGKDCPTTCDASTKPNSTESCGVDGSGTRSRSVTCDTSTLTWKTGSWGVCSYCTPGQTASGWTYCNNVYHTATCNYNGTGWNCACSASYDGYKSRCIRNMPVEGDTYPVKWWSEKTCNCYCFPSGTTIEPADNHYGFRAWLNHQEMAPTNTTCI